MKEKQFYFRNFPFSFAPYERVWPHHHFERKILWRVYYHRKRPELLAHKMVYTWRRENGTVFVTTGKDQFGIFTYW